MSNFNDLIGNITKYYSTTVAGTGDSFDIGDYNGEDLTRDIEQVEGEPDIELIAVADYACSFRRMVSVRKLTQQDYYRLFTNTAPSKVAKAQNFALRNADARRI